ncbi:MAG: type II toxin-antitoxin system RelE/ParE family toxin [Gammaproteobacteria bacterium]|nr:type II toxin-antitoxin system RelE/ParE family toxin [Gammaproteobacteria bacterium]
MEIVWSPLAVEKVGDFALRIAADKPMVPEIGRMEIREIYNGNYRIIYKVLDDSIHILTVRHRRQLLSDSDLNT